MRKPHYKIVINCVLTVVIVFLTILFCVKYKIIIVSGDSMEPTLRDGQVIITSRDIGTIKESDIVIFEYSNELCIKRVIAIAGDEVIMKDNGIYLNGVKISEVTYDGEYKAYSIQEGELFVIGDNERYSFDSRDYGPIKIEVVKYIYR